MDKKAFFHDRVKLAETTKERLFFSAIYLFSIKGYTNVGIRELCRSVSIKESSFYNHYRSKEELFHSILDLFEERLGNVIFSEEEIEKIIARKSVRYFFYENMKKFAEQTNDPIFQTTLQIVTMESFTDARAFRLSRNHIYFTRREYTEHILSRLQEVGVVQSKIDVSAVTMEYYYALKGMLDEFLLREVWDTSAEEVSRKILQHIDFFVQILE